MFERALGFPPAFVQGFSDRQGGVSEPPYDTLNLGTKWGDAPERVAENLARLAAAAGFRAEDLVRARQVHGAEVVRAREVGPETEADAVWAAPGDARVCGVMTADCVPVLLAGPAGHCAAVHAGWRGVVAGVVPAAVAVLAGAGAAPEQLRAAIGPCIELGAFEVGEELAEVFDALAPTLARGVSVRLVERVPGRRPHVDLVAAVRSQLLRSGLAPGAIERVGSCTHDAADRYFSYRRDGAPTGQQLSFIGWRAPPGDPR